MPTLVPKATRIQGSGNKPILIDEFIGRVNSRHEGVSVAYLHSRGGWIEPGQTPDFDEFTVVLRGVLRVAYRTGFFDVPAGQTVIAHRGEWVQYSTPDTEGADFIAVCVPAFSIDGAHRDPAAET